MLILPYTQNVKRKWKLLYVYNLQTIRDIFVYCAMKREVRKDDLYKAMAKFIIPPPNGRYWIHKKIERKERLRLEYIHATLYLDLIKEKNGKFVSGFTTMAKEKQMILKANNRRVFLPSRQTLPFIEEEKKAFRKILFKYSVAKDFLSWFMPNINETSENEFAPRSVREFKKRGKPLYLLGSIRKGAKGSDTVYRDADKMKWQIPKDYIRMVYVLKSWFIELDVIDSVVLFSDFSFDELLWHMIYPIKVSSADFERMDFKGILDKIIGDKDNKKGVVVLPIPYLIYRVVKWFRCPVSAVKRSIINLQKLDYTKYHLERASLPTLNRKYKESYLLTDGFYRSTLKIYKEY